MDTNTAHWRQHGRAVQYRAWNTQYLEEKQTKEANARATAQRRLQKQRAVLELLRLEKELESRRCQLCDNVRATAWGLGHANWMERRCGRCWAAHAEQAAMERHFGNLAASGRSTAPNGPLTQLPPAMLQALRQLDGSEAQQLQASIEFAHHARSLRVMLTAPSTAPATVSQHDPAAKPCPDTQAHPVAFKTASTHVAPPADYRTALSMVVSMEESGLLAEAAAGPQSHMSPVCAAGDAADTQGFGSDVGEGQEGSSIAQGNRARRATAPGSATAAAMPVQPAAKAQHINDASESESVDSSERAEDVGQAGRAGRGISKPSKPSVCAASQAPAVQAARTQSWEVAPAQTPQGAISATAGSSVEKDGQLSDDPVAAAVRSHDVDALLTLLGPSGLEQALQAVLSDRPGGNHPSSARAATSPGRSIQLPSSAAPALSLSTGGGRASSVPAGAAASRVQDHPHYQAVRRVAAQEHAAVWAAEAAWLDAPTKSATVDNALLKPAQAAKTAASQPPMRAMAVGSQPNIAANTQQRVGSAGAAVHGSSPGSSMPWAQGPAPVVFAPLPVTCTGRAVGQGPAGFHPSGVGSTEPASRGATAGLPSGHMEQQQRQGGNASAPAAGAVEGRAQGPLTKPGKAVQQKAQEASQELQESMAQVVKREGVLRAQLQEAEEVLVCGATQKERTAALFLATNLREELGRLMRDSRRLDRALQMRKHALRANPRDAQPARGLKHVLGRYIPPETALPHPAASTRLQGGRSNHPRPSYAPPTNDYHAVVQPTTAWLEGELGPEVKAAGSSTGQQTCGTSGRVQRGLGLPAAGAAVAPAVPIGVYLRPQAQAAATALPGTTATASGLLHGAAGAAEDGAASTLYMGIGSPGMQQLPLSRDNAPGGPVQRKLRAAAIAAASEINDRGLDGQGWVGGSAGGHVTNGQDPTEYGLNGRVAGSMAAAGCGQGGNLFKRLAGARATHHDTPDLDVMVDQVTWRPASMFPPPLDHPPGLCSVGDYEELDPMLEFAKLRAMPVDDFKTQLRKKKEWQAALHQAQRELGCRQVGLGLQPLVQG